MEFSFISLSDKALLALISTVFSLSMFIFLLIKNKKTQLFYSVLILQLLGFLWAFGKTLELISVNSSSQWFAFQFLFLSFHFGGLSWLVFCFLFAKKEFNFNRLLIPPLFIHLFFLTNPYHHLYFLTTDYSHYTPGLGFKLAVIIASIYVITGVTILMTRISNKNSTIRKQVWLMILAVVVPFIFGIISAINMIFYKDSLPIRSLSAISFTIMTLLVTIVIFRYNFLNVIPVAQRKIFDNLREMIVLIDNDINIIDYNKSFEDNFPTAKPEFIDFFKNDIDYSDNEKKILSGIMDEKSYMNVSGELYFKQKDKYFYVSVMPLNIDAFLGRIVSFIDITEYRKTLSQMNNINKLLELKSLEPQIFQMFHETIDGLQNVYNSLTANYNQNDNKILKPDLTYQELFVINFIVQGKSNKEIASSLNRSEGRVKKIITNILSKLGLEDRTQIAVYAMKNNLVKE